MNLEMKMRRVAKRQSSQDTDSIVIDQAAALCLRISPDGERQILLVGSRRNGRWGLPKGHIDPGELSHTAAEREAYEEAGVRGDISDAIVGSFIYSKDSSSNRYRVIVHCLMVGSMEETYPEMGLRTRQWFALPEAATVAGHEGLRSLLRTIT